MHTDFAKQCPACNMTFAAKAQFCHRDGSELHVLPAPIGAGALRRQEPAAAPLALERTGVAMSAGTGPMVAAVTNPGMRPAVAHQFSSPLAHLSDRGQIEAAQLQAASTEQPAPWSRPAAGSPVPAGGLSTGRLLLVLATLAVGFALLVWILAIAFWPPTKPATVPEPPAASEPAPAEASPDGPAVDATEPPPSGVERRTPDPVPAPAPRPTPRTTKVTPAKTAPPAKTNSPASRARSARRNAALARAAEARLERAKELRKAREKAAKRARKRAQESEP